MGRIRVAGSKQMIEAGIPASAKDKVDITGGDTALAWPEQITADEAKATFDALVGQGFRGYKMTGASGEQIDVFDPNAAELLVMPPMAGGC